MLIIPASRWASPLLARARRCKRGSDLPHVLGLKSSPEHLYF
jgi:hypothetical protein